MIHTLQKGAKVKVWPRPGLRVKVGPDVMRDGRMYEVRALKPEGEEVEWSEWYNDLAKGGAIYFSDPRPGEGRGGVRHAEHVHPDDLADHLAAQAAKAAAEEAPKQAAADAAGKAE